MLHARARSTAACGPAPENGERGYQLTFAIAYIRDFMIDHWVLGESFETSVPWSEALALCANVKQRLWQEHAKRGLPGEPFVSCRVTQLYDTGVCIYFYFAFAYKGVEHASEVYAELERAAATRSCARAARSRITTASASSGSRSCRACSRPRRSSCGAR